MSVVTSNRFPYRRFCKTSIPALPPRGCYVCSRRKSSVGLGMPLEHRVFLWGTHDEYRLYETIVRLAENVFGDELSHCQYSFCLKVCDQVNARFYAWDKRRKASRSVCKGSVISQNCEKRLLASSCLSIHPHGTTRLPLDGIWWNFDIWGFFENLLRHFKFH